VINTVKAGATTIFIAEVLASQAGENGDPLLYFNRDYRKIQKS